MTVPTVNTHPVLLDNVSVDLGGVRVLENVSFAAGPGTLVGVVGPNGSGKSTLFNVLTKSTVHVQDKPFSTLDPVTRRVLLPNGSPALFTDTVGFIQKLPSRIVAAFRATLEELQAADLLLHVVDITHKNAAQQAQEVVTVLDDLGLADTPTLLVLNQ